MLLIALSALGGGLVWAREFTHGVTLHWDSINYIAVARNLLAGQGFVQVTGGPLVLWPPLYPLLLAAASLGVFDPHAVAGPLNVALFGLTVFLTGRWLRRRLASRCLRLWSYLAVALAPSVVAQASWALSETFFGLLIMLSLIRLDHFLRRGRLAALVQAAAFAAWVPVIRYVGAALPCAGALLLLARPSAPRGQQLQRAFAYAALAAVPLSLWLGRNFLWFRTAIGPRTAQIPWTEIAPATLNVVAAWIFVALPPETRGLRLGAGLALGALALVVGYGLIALLADKAAQSRKTSFCLFGAFTLLYIAASATGLRTVAPGDGVTQVDRYLAPAYIPLLCAVALALDSGWRYARTYRRPWIRRGAAFLAAGGLSAWLAFQIPLHAQAIVQANADGVPRSYTATAFAHAAVLRYVQEHYVQGPIASDLPWMTYLYADVDQNALTLLPSDLADVERWIAAAPEGAWLVWFHGTMSSHRNLAFSGGDLRLLPGLELQAELADGLIFAVNRSSTAPEAYAQTLAAAYADITSEPPRARAVFDVYLVDDAVAYVKSPCSLADVQARFMMHIRPVEADVLPAARQPLGFDNRDGDYVRYGARFNDQCLVTIPLPAYPIRELTVGQYHSNDDLVWQETIRLPFVDPRTDALRAAYEEAVASGPALHRSRFSLYRNGRTLIYAREACIPADIEARFFLHVYAARARLPRARRRHGFDNLDFDFEQHGARFEARCVAAVPLPAYDIDRIKTGQWVRDEGQIWVAEFPFPETPS